jgi:L-ascorbate metabolism protein UlaG (beta-lactamase superfamily)
LARPPCGSPRQAARSSWSTLADRQSQDAAAFKQLSALGKVDLILVTHAHGDHLGDAPIWPSSTTRRSGTGGMGQQLVSLGGAGQPGAALRQERHHPAIRRQRPEDHRRACRTFVGTGLEEPATGKDETHYGGEPVGYIIEMENGFKIWHMGDTGLYGDMMLVADRYKPDLVLIPIGGHFTMGPQDAAIACAISSSPGTRSRSTTAPHRCCAARPTS